MKGWVLLHPVYSWCWQGIKREASQACDARKILVECEDANAMLQSDSRDEYIDRCEAHPLGPSQAKNRCCFPVCTKAAGLQQVPLGKVVFDTAYIPCQPLKDFCDHHPCERKGLSVADHSPQLASGAARGGTEKIDPHRTIHQDQLRFLRMALTSPFQIPVP